MKQTLITKPELEQFGKQDIAIAKMAEMYLPLKIEGIDDKAGFKRVFEARQEVKAKRISVEKTRKQLKADALEYGRMVDSEAKRIFSMIEPIENHLQGEEDRINAEKERILKEAESKRQGFISARVNALVQLGFANVNPMSMADMPEAEYQELLAVAKIEHDERQRKQAQEKAEQDRLAQQQRIEAAKLAAERAELDAMRAKQKAEQDRIDAERRNIEEEKLAQQRAAEMERVKSEAAEQARIETEQRISREQERARHEAERKEREAKESAEREAAAKLKAEQERPYREKIIAFSVKVASLVDDIPTGLLTDRLIVIINRAVKQIREIANGEM